MAPFTPKGDNPFNPGAGLPPPLLAGRDAQLAFFKNAIGRAKRMRVGRAVVVYAPRGMGKTVLMRRLRTELGKDHADTVFVMTRPDRKREIPMSDLERLLPTTTPPADKKTVQKHGGIRAGVHAGVSTTETWSGSGQDRRALFERSLMQSCAERPTVLVIDEAHRLQDGDRIELLNMTQELTGDGMFLCVLAGTPSLIQSLAKGATFGDRFEEMSLSMLDETAAMEALQTPLGRGGIDIDTDPLREIVRKSHGYPYFLQLWGEALWDYSAEHGASRLTDAHARAVEPVVDARRMSYYNKRFEEVRKSHELRAAATTVADAYAVAGQYDKDGISEVVNLALAQRIADEDGRWEKAESIIAELVALGYIWQPAGQQYMEAGIPSLMDYVRQRRPDAQPQLSPDHAIRASRASVKRQSGPLL